MTPATRQRPGAVDDTFREVPSVAKRTAEERFWAKVDRNGPIPDYAPELGPCWIWTANTSGGTGYGNFWLGRSYGKAHRFSYELMKGAIPDGLDLDHLCRVRACVNPAHLEAVTRQENIKRSPIAIATRNAAKTHCPKGHPYAGDNLYIARGRRTCRACLGRSISGAPGEESG